MNENAHTEQNSGLLLGVCRITAARSRACGPSDSDVPEDDPIGGWSRARALARTVRTMHRVLDAGAVR
ncbi:hypothetical protein [Streptomyces sp. HUAS TT3]|uniref:hypothetical protein n=1 Tax=Streptomyces sp. HUAS TT3 TaxID=3447510 RepID=UPI003F654DAE